ncbi:hypothetical protein MMC26_004564 [Xylographa opegraphella]|nr:hypothetical protein [Xylographa opegraphella]
MFKNRNITDFFKPFANPRPAKRAKYGGEDEQVKENNTPVAESSSSARIAVRAKHNPTDARPSLDELTTSSLSSLQSDDSTFYIPDKIPQDIVAQDTLSSTTFPLVASSQRVSRNGEFMIRNSDDDTDSEISLEDIRDILIGKKPTVRSSPPIEPDLPPQPTANRVRPSRQTEISRFSRVSTTLPPTTKYKFSLAALVAKAEQDDATDEGTAQARQLIESLEDRRAALEAKIDQDLGIENPVGGLLASVAEKYGDGDTLGKLMQAIERTEALSMQNCWSFFESTTSESLEAESNSPKDFPRIVSSLLPHSE